MEKVRKAHRILTWNPEENGPLGRPMRRRDANMKIDRKTGNENVDWTHLAQDKGAVAGSCKYGNEPSVSIKVGNFLTS
jgi:hypothetical protein